MAAVTSYTVFFVYPRRIAVYSYGIYGTAFLANTAFFALFFVYKRPEFRYLHHHIGDEIREKTSNLHGYRQPETPGLHTFQLFIH